VARGAPRNFRIEVGLVQTAASRRPALSTEQRSEQWVVGGFWPGTYVIKKGHARDIYFLLHRRAIFGTLAPPLLSLRAAIYSPVPPGPFIGCIGSSHMKLGSDRSADLTKGFALV
jgi:hypothetical protein